MTAVRALASVLANADLRRAESAFALGLTAEYASWVAILVYAYRHGGPAETGIIAAVQLVPAGVFLPLVGVAADRFGATRSSRDASLSRR